MEDKEEALQRSINTNRLVSGLQRVNEGKGLRISEIKKSKTTLNRINS